MTLLNRDDGFYYLYTDRSGKNSYKDKRPNCVVWLIREWEDRDYYYIDFFEGNTFEVFPIDTIVPEDILEKIKTDDKTFLYLCNTHEAFLHIVKPLYESLVINEGIPARKIYLSNEAIDLASEVKRYADENNLEYMNVEIILEFENQNSMQTNIMNLTGETMLTDKKYDKKFLNFNRRWRLHRPALVALLKIKGLLDKGYVSLGNSDDGNNWARIYQWIKAHHSVDPELSELFTKHEEEIVNMPALYLDTEDLVTNRALIEQQSLYLYENSIVSVVTETTFYQVPPFNNARFLSEKIFKPIGIGHPFIFVTVPKSLEALKSLGYKTFHPYIDESYDDEFNDFERMKKIVKEIERISNFTDEKVREFCKNVKPICDYNQTLLKSKTRLGTTESNFVKKTL